MAKKLQRAFALVAALLFLGTSVAVSIVVVWQAHQQSQTDQQNQDNSSNTDQVEKIANFTPVSNVSKLVITDTKVGSGQAVKPGDSITVLYTGAYASDGVIFDSSDKHGGQPIPLDLNKVIEGWQKGIPGMKVGGTRRLLIPAAQAYGSTPPPGIRPNADMVFDIELVSIQQ